MKWWMRFGMGWGVLGQLVNMVMLSTALSPTFARHLGVPVWVLVVCLPPCIILCITLVGWGLDRIQWYQRVDMQSRKRSWVTDDLFARLERIERKLDAHNRNPDI